MWGKKVAKNTEGNERNCVSKKEKDKVEKECNNSVCVFFSEFHGSCIVYWVLNFFRRKCHHYTDGDGFAALNWRKDRKQCYLFVLLCCDEFCPNHRRNKDCITWGWPSEQNYLFSYVDLDPYRETGNLRLYVSFNIQVAVFLAVNHWQYCRSIYLSCQYIILLKRWKWG